jgi:hypothetical protein
MADGSIYVAVIAASAAILGAAVSAVSVAHQNARQAARDGRQRREERQQRHEDEVRSACLDLLRAAIEQRTQVEDNEGYQGEEMRSRLARVRKHASEATLCRVRIGMLEPVVFAELAGKLDKAAGNLALAASENTNLEMSMSTEVPDIGELNDCIEAFSRRAVAYAKGET